MTAPIAYLTDVEGMWTRLASFALGNPLVRFDGDRLVVSDGAIFVFGGDAIDRGPDSRRVVATLLEAKRRQPEQVILLAGNRDINKLRLPRELSGEPPRRVPEDVRTGPRGDLLRWIFVHTMGAPHAFELRRQELEAERSEHPDDEAVVDSFLADLRPGSGPLAEYLAVSQLAFRHGPTLFVHGGLSEESLGHVPGLEPIPVVDAWASALNRFYATQLEAYREGRVVNGEPGFWPLVRYQAPRPGSRLNPASVVYGRSADAENNLILPSRAVTDRLRTAGIRRAVVGHTPSGDSPSLGRRDGFTYLMADNSHARHGAGSRVYFDDGGTRVDAWTRLDGDEAGLHAVRFRVDDDDLDSPIGLREAEGGRLVRGRLSSGAWLTYRALPEYRNEQRAVDELSGWKLEPPE